MPAIETLCLKQKAVLWAFSDYDKYGDPKVSNTPVEIDVRWEQKLEENISDDATVIATTGEVFVDQDIAKGSLLWLGKLADLPSPATSGLVEVVSCEEIPDIKGRVFQRTATIRKFRGALPAQDIIAEARSDNSPGASGSQTISLASATWNSKTPKLLFTATGFEDVADFGANIHIDFGCSDGTTNRTQTWFSQSNVTTSNSKVLTDTSNIVRVLDTDGSSLAQASLTSFGSEQFTLNWTEQTGRKHNYLVLGGDDLSAKVMEINSPTDGTGQKSYTGMGFKPDALMFYLLCEQSDGQLHDNILLSFGFWDGTTAFVSGIGSEHGVNPSNTYRVQKTGSVVAAPLQNAMFIEAEPVSLDTDGFTLDWTTASTPKRTIAVVGFKGGRYKVVTDTQGTSTGIKQTNIGFVPSAAILTTVMNAAASGIVDDHRLGIGFLGKAGGQSFVGTLDEDGISPTDTERMSDANECLKMAGHTPTILARATGSFNGRNLDLNWTVADSTARQWGGLFIGT